MKPAATRQLNTFLGIALTILGLVAHLLSARAIGGSHSDYRDHIAGFLLIAIVSGLLIAALGWRFWRGRFDVTLLIFGAIQGLMGAYVYVERFSVHT